LCGALPGARGCLCGRSFGGPLRGWLPRSCGWPRGLVVHHDEASEILEIETHPAPGGSPDVRRPLDDSARVVLHHEQDPGEVVGERMEGDDTVDQRLAPVRPPR